MTITFDLAPELVEHLAERAAQRGQDAASYTANLLRKDLEKTRRMTKDSSPNLSKFLEGYRGVFDSRATNGNELSQLADKTDADAKARIVNTLAVLDSFMEGDEQEQRKA